MDILNTWEWTFHFIWVVPLLILAAMATILRAMFSERSGFIDPPGPGSQDKPDM